MNVWKVHFATCTLVARRIFLLVKERGLDKSIQQRRQRVNIAKYKDGTAFPYLDQENTSATPPLQTNTSPNMKSNVFVAIAAVACVMTVSAVPADATSIERNDLFSYFLKCLVDLVCTRFAQTDCNAFHP